MAGFEVIPEAILTIIGIILNRRAALMCRSATKTPTQASNGCIVEGYLGKCYFWLVVSFLGRFGFRFIAGYPNPEPIDFLI